MDHDPGFVIGGSASEETIAPAGGDERFGVPILGASGRLHVVMGVEEDGRGAFGRRHGGHDGRVSRGSVGLVGAEDVDVEAEVAGQAGDRLGAGRDIRGVEARPGDGGNGYEIREIAEDLLEDGVQFGMQLCTVKC